LLFPRGNRGADRNNFGDRFAVAEDANSIASFDRIEKVFGAIAQLGKCGISHSGSCTLMYSMMYILIGFVNSQTDGAPIKPAAAQLTILGWRRAVASFLVWKGN
jgi:hypothetical protein